MKRKISLLIAAILMTLAIFSGCGNNRENVTQKDNKNAIEVKKNAITDDVNITKEKVIFTDARGKKVSINKNPKKVICLYNSYLDLWYKCGGKVIGRVEEAKEKSVEEANNATSVGSPGNPSLEMILSLKPDLVILSSGFKAQMALVDTLEKNNIQVIAYKSELKNDYYKMVRIFTALTGREDLYQKNGYEVKEKIDNIIKKVPKDKKPTVLVLFATGKGLTTKNSNSMVGEMLKDLGAINIADSFNENDSNIFSMEKIIEKDPEFIFVQTMGRDINSVKDRLKKDAETNPAWKNLKAVKGDNYTLLPKNLYLYRPNDKYAEAYERLAKELYPDVFK